MTPSELLSTKKKWALTEKEKKSDPARIPDHDLRNRFPLLYQLSCKARWELVVENKHGNLR